jgi:hypothetical protein
LDQYFLCSLLPQYLTLFLVDLWDLFYQWFRCNLLRQYLLRYLLVPLDQYFLMLLLRQYLMKNRLLLQVLLVRCNLYRRRRRRRRQYLRLLIQMQMPPVLKMRLCSKM